MDESFTHKIIESRKLLKNPYAYLSGEGSYEAVETRIDKPSVEQISKNRNLLEDPYAYLDENGGFDAIHNQSIGEHISFVLSAEQIRAIKPKRKKQQLSNDEIEKVVIKLQRILWKQFKGSLDNPIKLLDPSITFKAIGYDYHVENTLGQFSSQGKSFEVAGIINNALYQVQISRQFPYEVQKFTSAHELGHAILHEHEARGLHRDRPLDGSENNTKRDSIEYQADKFAVYFLMPSKLLIKIFREHFLTECFVLNDDTIFALGSTTAAKIENYKSIRDLSRLLAKIEIYNGVNFNSLSRQFGVSVEAMAIRLEELKLCK